MSFTLLAISLMVVGLIIIAVGSAAAITRRKFPSQGVQAPQFNQNQMSSPTQKMAVEDMKAAAPPIQTADTIHRSTPSPTLPKNCSSCGSPVRPDKVKWLDEYTAECSYCGQVLHGNVR